MCDRATVLREGVTVGVVDVTAGSEDRIVSLMLGDAVKTMADRGTGRRPTGRWRLARRRASRSASCARTRA